MTSPSLPQPTQRRRPRWSAPAPTSGPPSRRRATNVLVGSVALAAACSSGNPSATPTSDGSTPPTSPPSVTATPSQQSLLLSQYSRFWASLASVSRLPASERRSALAAFAIDPALKSVVAGMTKLDRKGEVLYGRDLPRPTSHVGADGKTAVVDDCQDSTKAGAANRTSMTPITVGVARNHVVVTMKRGGDGLWKVAFVSYTKTPC